MKYCAGIGSYAELYADDASFIRVAIEELAMAAAS